MLDFLFLGLFLAFAPKGTRVTGLSCWLGWLFFCPPVLRLFLHFSKNDAFFGPKPGVSASLVPTQFLASCPRKSPATPRRAVQNARTKRPVLARVYPARPMPRKTRNAVSRKGPWVRIPNSPPFFCEKRLIGLCLSGAFPLLSRNTRTREGCFETLFLFSPFSAGENTPKFGEESGEKSAIRSAQGRSA